jgi:hypothetical protein
VGVVCLGQLASRACAECAAGLVEAGWGQPGDAPSKRGAGQRVNVVKVDDAVAWNVVLGGGQFQLGHQAPAGTGQCRHDNRAYPVRNRISGEDKYGPGTARRGGEP